VNAFKFSDREWDRIRAELAPTGPIVEFDRRKLEFFCLRFVASRPRLGRNAPAPKKARAAWRTVAAATHRLEVAIAGLPPAGAKRLTFWARHLPQLRQAADSAADFETAGARKVSNTADVLRDTFVKNLLLFWKGRNARVAHAEDGPLVRFLSAVTAPALTQVGEQPMTHGQIRASVRRHLKRASMAS
jgi:hypothetical protein